MAKELYNIWKEVKNIQFDVYEITGNFNSTSTFSSVHLSYKKYYDPILDVNLMVRCHSLFEFDPDVLPEGMETALAFITKDCKLIQWPPPSSTHLTHERHVLLALHQIFTPLSRADEVIYEKKYLFSDAGIRTENIGMGTTETWHGSPDARVRGCEIVLMKRDGDRDDDGDDDDEEGSCSSSDPDTEVSTDGASTNIEVKRKARFKDNFGQLVSTCVVSSFTEHHQHPSKNTLVPSILIDMSMVRVCLYDCVSDVLLVSEPRLLSHKGIRLSTTAVFFLWLVMNHRIYLRPLPEHFKMYKCTISQRLESDGVLPEYRGLKWYGPGVGRGRISKRNLWSSRGRE